ncbi:MAG: hypothetical protein KBD05_02010 [Candidatus Pacebacteria bacterium]|nr:hypothetical protein [Candidatus Paceibacterota bacterium]
MSRAGTLILLGILIALTPFIGLPLSLLAWVLPILGLLVLLTGVALRRRMQAEERSAEPPAAAPASFDIHEPPQA